MLYITYIHEPIRWKYFWEYTIKNIVSSSFQHLFSQLVHRSKYYLFHNFTLVMQILNLLKENYVRLYLPSDFFEPFYMNKMNVVH